MAYLTKSRFKLALSCPTKLYYQDQKEYENKKELDSFLQALAEGGYQVGELAKCYYPNGYDVTEKGHKDSIERTNELLKQENVIIYEAAFQYENLFIRVDVLEKKGNTVNLIEVKAKSYEGRGTDEFLTKKGFVDGGWNDYLQDVAFQKYVMSLSYPNWNITAHLMLADKSKKASVDGINQLFLLVKDSNGRASVQKSSSISENTLGDPILTTINVDEIANRIINDDIYAKKPEIQFADKINLWANSCKTETKLVTPIGAHCFGCEFNTSNPLKKSGFNECWKQGLNLKDEHLKKRMIHEIWNFRGKENLFQEGIIFMEDVEKEHFKKLEPKANGTLSNTERQWMQVEKEKLKNDEFYLDRSGMKEQMKSFTYPLHFIDFETSMVAIPFYLGQCPYEQIAFQFSHHIMYADGRVEHIGEYIELERGKFPNFDFVRKLKAELDKDSGTIFRFATHENTVLNQISRQILAAELSLLPDREELLAFIYSITYETDKRAAGIRNMVDMCQMVKDYFFDPRTGGSNSIKAVLPAVLGRSEFIQQRYSKPIYGKNSEIKSKNFNDGWSWIQFDDEGKVKDPYKLLPKLFNDIDLDQLDNLMVNEELNNGGTALTAFAKMQFTEMSDMERKQIVAGLLKYCELDTLAMVMIYEFWKHEVEH